jgi:hypothetical protein
MEQMIKGQMGQPAACMIESKLFSRGLFAAPFAVMRGIMADARQGKKGSKARAPGPKQDVHHSCGQLCAKPRRAAPNLTPLVANEHVAKFSSKVFLMRIKGLRVDDGCVTGAIASFAPVGAPVEFPSRASRGFWRG